MNRKTIVAALVLALAVGGTALADEGEHQKGYLGVTLHSTEMVHHHDGRADDMELKKRVGLFVGRIVPGGPAETAGLAPKDKIVAIDGRDVSDLDGLHEAMEGRLPGDRVSVTVDRGGREQTFDVVLGERPTKTEIHVERFGMAVDPGHGAFVGIESQPVGEQLARFFEVDGGVLVSRVIDGSGAEQAGVEAGDVILAWNDREIRNSHDLHQAIADAEPGDRINLTVSRRGIESVIPVTLGSVQDMKHEHLLRMKEAHFEMGHKYKVKIKEKKGDRE